MAHQRVRYLMQNALAALKYSGAVGVLGQRQVGKTTLVSALSSEYITFDGEGRLLEALQSPETFLMNRKKPFGIDECQLCPELFPAIKDWLRKRPAKGQFLLTGSVRFTSRKLIRESLTGRIVNLEMLPLTIAESSSKNLPTILKKISQVTKNSDLLIFQNQSIRELEKQAHTYLSTGGLPGICFFREKTVRHQKFEAHLETLLNRDLRLILETSILYPNLRALLEFMAQNQGRPFEITKASRFAEISKITIKKIIFAFEAIFLIRPVLTIGTSLKKSYFLEDQGMASWLMKRELVEGQDIERLFFSNLRQEFHYGAKVSGGISQYRTRDGSVVPLVFENDGRRVGIIATRQKTPSPAALGSANSFLRKFPEAKVIIAHSGSEISTRDFKVIQVPFSTLLSTTT